MASSFFLSNVAAVAIGFLFYRKFRFHQENKKITSSSLSLLPPPPSLPQTWKHHVFPSFHGPDVRRAFLGHIMKVFKSKAIDIFIDNDRERSESIGPMLEEAIRGSRIAIVLLSKNYASSTCCLDELVEIIKCREKFGQKVMAIFYEVDPTDIKKQTGDFGKVFKKTCKGKTEDIISTCFSINFRRRRSKEIQNRDLRQTLKSNSDRENMKNDSAYMKKSKQTYLVRRRKSFS